jgi:hypothetical protein
LKAVGIKNTYNLVGQFLIFKEEEQSPQALCDKMFTFIKDAGKGRKGLDEREDGWIRYRFRR